MQNGKGMRGEGVNWKLGRGSSRLQFTDRCDKTRKNYFVLLLKRKESCARSEIERERERERGTFFPKVLYTL